MTEFLNDWQSQEKRLKELGYYHDEVFGEPCEHVVRLRRYLEGNRLQVFSDVDGEDEDEDEGCPIGGWVSVYCARCSSIYQGMLYDDTDEGLLGPEEEGTEGSV